MAAHMAANERTEQLMEAARRVVKKVPFMLVTREMVANEAGVSRTLVNRYFGSVVELQAAIVKQAVADENVQVIAQAISVKHAGIARIKGKFKAAVVAHLFG